MINTNQINDFNENRVLYIELNPKMANKIIEDMQQFNNINIFYLN